MKITELGFYKKKTGFEGAQDVLDFYNKAFNKTSPVELMSSSLTQVHR
jgi:hypothetical protein